MRNQGRKHRSLFSSIDTLEPRRLLATISWDGGGGDSLWSNALNWSGNVIPAAADDVTISNAPAVVTSGSSKRVLSLSLISSTLTLGSGLTGLSNLSLTDSTLKVGTSASGPADVQAQFLAMSNVSRIEGQAGSTLWTSLISAFGSGGSVIDLPMSVIGIEVSGGDLRINRCANLVDGVLSTGGRNWYVSGRLEMNGGAPILINQGSLSLSGPMAQVAGLENLTRNEGGLSFTNHTAHFTGSLTNAGTLAFSGRTSADALFMTVDGVFNAAERLNLSFLADGSSASDAPTLIQAGGVVGQFAEVNLSGNNVLASVTPVYALQSVSLEITARPPNSVAILDRTGTYPLNSGSFTNQTLHVAQIGTNDVGTVEVYVDDVLVRTFTSTSRDAAMHTVQLPMLAPGLRRLRACLVDPQGVRSAESTGYSFTVDLTPPALTTSVFQFESIQSVAFTFNENVRAVSGAERFVLKDAAGNVMPAPGATSSVSQNTVTVSFSRTAPLKDGNWTLQLPASSFTDLAENPLPASASQAFYTLAGDANRDRMVDFSDLLILSQNYGRTGQKFSQGNFSYDSSGRVNFDDLLILSQRYGTSVPVARSVAQPNRRERTLTSPIAEVGI